MSFKVLTLVYSRITGSPVRKAILTYCAERASDGGEGVWASKGTIAAATEYGRSTVFRTFNELVTEGYLIPVGTRPCKNGETVEYDMNLDLIMALPMIKEEEYIPRYKLRQPVPERDQSQSGTPPVPQRDPYQSQSGTQTPLRTSIEPSSARPANDGARVEPVSAGFYNDLLQALRVTAKDGWAEKRGRAHVATWLAQGLTEEQILGVALRNAQTFSEPPRMPKALDGAMAEAAKVSEGQTRLSHTATLNMLADMINGPRYFPANGITMSLARELVERGMVTAENLKHRGIAH